MKGPLFDIVYLVLDGVLLVSLANEYWLSAALVALAALASGSPVALLRELSDILREKE